MIRSQVGASAQPLPYAAAGPRQRFSPFKRSLRAGHPRPGSARAVLSASAANAAPGGGTAQLLLLHEGSSLVGGQRSDVPMQRLLGGKARLRPQVRRTEASLQLLCRSPELYVGIAHEASHM